MRIEGVAHRHFSSFARLAKPRQDGHDVIPRLLLLRGLVHSLIFCTHDITIKNPCSLGRSFKREDEPRGTRIKRSFSSSHPSSNLRFLFYHHRNHVRQKEARPKAATGQQSGNDQCWTYSLGCSCFLWHNVHSFHC